MPRPLVVLFVPVAVPMLAVGGLLLARQAPVLDESLTRPDGDTTVAPPDDAATTILAAGDIADCNGGAAATAALLEKIDGVVAPLGDLAYDHGTVQQYEECYLPTWGRLLERTRPAQGNHDVRTAGAAGYYDTFGELAGPQPQGYYDYRLGDWLIVVVNSNCAQVGGCDADNPQVEWLRDTLDDAATGNILAYWHHPRWSTGRHGDDPAMDTIWRTLAEAGADIVLSGHDHDYQRFTPLDGDGDPAHSGLRQFVVGTGGKGLRPFAREDQRIEFRDDSRLGILEVELQPCGYGWAFHATDGTVTDSGQTTSTC